MYLKYFIFKKQHYSLISLVQCLFLLMCEVELKMKFFVVCGGGGWRGGGAENPIRFTKVPEHEKWGEHFHRVILTLKSVTSPAPFLGLFFANFGEGNVFRNCLVILWYICKRWGVIKWTNSSMELAMISCYCRMNNVDQYSENSVVYLLERGNGTLYLCLL